MHSACRNILALLLLFSLSSWGFYAHRLINENAIYCLPTELARFYKKHAEAIREKAIDADKRAYIDSAEGPKHFIDLDRYAEPLDSIPIHWSQAIDKYPERMMRARGIVPWQVFLTYQRLVQAFISKNSAAIIRHSADLGHYLADAHVPLHSTKNYNGQLTQQIGIHGLWESRLPEMYATQYNLLVGKAFYVEDPLALAWQAVQESHSLVDSVLSIDKKVANSLAKASHKSYLSRNNKLELTYSDAYAKAYHQALNGMVERRMRQSILRLSCLWYSAWLEAGQPDLTEESTAAISRPDAHL